MTTILMGAAIAGQGSGNDGPSQDKSILMLRLIKGRLLKEVGV